MPTDSSRRHEMTNTQEPKTLEEIRKILSNNRAKVTDPQLVALILGKGSRDPATGEPLSAIAVAEALFDEAGDDLPDLITAATLREIDERSSGMGWALYNRLIAAIELAQRWRLRQSGPCAPPTPMEMSVTITRCTHCGVDQRGERQPDPVARSFYPQPHNGPDGEPCPGNELQAIWVNPSSAEHKFLFRHLSANSQRTEAQGARPNLIVIIDGELFVREGRRAGRPAVDDSWSPHDEDCQDPEKVCQGAEDAGRRGQVVADPTNQSYEAGFIRTMRTLTAEGSAGGGLVVAKANGYQTLTRIRIAPEAMTDIPRLERLIAKAVNRAVDEAERQAPPPPLISLTIDPLD